MPITVLCNYNTKSSVFLNVLFILSRYWHWTGTHCNGVPVDTEKIKRFPVSIIAPNSSLIKEFSLQSVVKIQRFLGPPKYMWEKGGPNYPGIRPPRGKIHGIGNMKKIITKRKSKTP